MADVVKFVVITFLGGGVSLLMRDSGWAEMSSFMMYMTGVWAAASQSRLG